MRTSLLSLFLVACGGAVTSVDGNQSTSNLAPADQNQLCIDTYDYVRNNFTASDIAKMECGFSQTTQTNPATCAATYQSCVTAAQANLGQFQYPATPDCTSFDASIAKCNTTVAEYTKCLQQEINAMKSLESNFPLCSDTAATAAELAALNDLSADCVQLMKTCSITFAPSTSSGGSAGGPDGG